MVCQAARVRTAGSARSSLLMLVFPDIMASFLAVPESVFAGGFISSRGTRFDMWVNFAKSGKSVKQAFRGVAVRSNLVMGEMARASSILRMKELGLYISLTTLPPPGSSQLQQPPLLCPST